jgi:hypothetical protein
MKKWLKTVNDCDAAEVAELAVVLPLLMSVIFAIFSFGRAYNIYSTVTRAAQEGVRVAVTPQCVNCTLACVVNSQFPCDPPIEQAVTGTLAASHIDPSRILLPSPAPNPPACPAPAPAKSCAPASGGSNVYICRNVALTTNTNTALQACGTIVSFRYNYRLLPIPFFNLQTINIPARAQMTAEY